MVQSNVGPPPASTSPRTPNQLISSKQIKTYVRDQLVRSWRTAVRSPTCVFLLNIACLYAYMVIYMYIHTFFVCARTYTCYDAKHTDQIHVYICMHVCIHTCMHKYTHIHTESYRHAYTRTYIRTCMNTYTCIQTYIHT